MKTIRRSLLVLSLLCCGFFLERPTRVVAGEGTPSVPVQVVALENQPTAESLSPPSPDAAAVRCAYLVAVADDFIVEVYHNGRRVPDAQREMLLDRFGASAEKIHVPVREGDWLVFHVVQNRLRWGGSKYFAVAGCLAENEFGFVSDPASADWSVCDDPGRVRDFIKHRNAGRFTRASTIEVPWGEGDDFIKQYAGKDFAGKALWGRAPSTWIKFNAGQPGGPEPEPNTTPAPPVELESRPAEPAPPAPPVPPVPVEVRPFEAKKWPVQILSAIYGTGGKDADVTAKVKDHVENLHHMFSVNPQDLGADPNPYWNKGLHIVYMKDGVRREQHRNENEWVLPESFYGPQDAGELRSWLPELRWFGEQPEIQFHADQTFTSPGVSGTYRWEATGANSLKLTWSEDRVAECVFDYTWSSFSEVGNGRNVFHLRK